MLLIVLAYLGGVVRRGIGVAILAGVAAIATGLDTGLLTRVATVATGGVEQRLLDFLSPSRAGPLRAGPATAEPGSIVLTAQATPAATAPQLPVEGRIPPLTGAVQWLNSQPLDAQQLRGKVVLLDIWTYSCINCLRTLPYVKAWAQKYKDDGLVVIGVHDPEFAFERDVGNVRHAVADLGITYPVAIDNDYAIWDALSNEYWPAHYLVDAQGRIRYHYFGEGSYDETERAIQQFVRQRGAVSDHTFEIEFLDPGAHAYSFTFG